ncbi:MAG: hypothetical protein Q9227_009107 [Pyrenula ochraceoflavens]
MVLANTGGRFALPMLRDPSFAALVIPLKPRMLPVVYLDILLDGNHAEPNQAGPDIIAIHQNGQIRILSGDLSVEKFTTTPKGLEDGKKTPSILMASVLTLEEERERLLRGRNDLMSNFRASAHRFVLMLLSRESQSTEDASSLIKIHIFGVAHDSKEAPSSLARSDRVQLLTSSVLPQSDRWSSEQCVDIQYHKPTSTLCVTSPHVFISYTSLSYLPRVSGKFEDAENSYSSFQRLSPSDLLAFSKQGVIAINLKYGTAQHQVDAEKVLGKSGSRPSLETEEKYTLPQFFTYFPAINYVVALVAQSLVSFEVSRTTTQLVNAIGYGAQKFQTGKAQQIENKSNALLRAYNLERPLVQPALTGDQVLVDKLVLAGNIIGFEESMANVLCKTCSNEMKEQIIGGLRLPARNELIHQSVIDFVLSKIFAKSPLDSDTPKSNLDDPPGVHIAFLPPRIFQWLIENGYITSSCVRSALLGRTGQIISTNLITCALIDCDPSLRWLQRYLHDAPEIDLNELIWVVNMLLGQVKANLRSKHDSERLLLPAGEEQDAEKRVNNTNEDHEEITIHTGLGRAIATVSPNMDSDITLKTALKRLDNSPKSRTISILRARCSSEEVFDLIQYLREQLFLGGHTSHSRNQVSSNLPSPPTSIGPQEDVANDVPPLELFTIIRLLSCCIDSLGPLSFVSTQSGDDFFEKLIHQLRDEISAALAGVEEASYVQGLLREVLRYSASVRENTDRNRPSILSRNHRVSNQRPGTIMTLYAVPPAEQGDREMPLGALPLNLKADEAVSDTVVRKGGGQILKRSFREKAHLERQRKIGKYSYERLVL